MQWPVVLDGNRGGPLGLLRHLGPPQGLDERGRRRTEVRAWPGRLKCGFGPGAFATTALSNHAPALPSVGVGTYQVCGKALPGEVWPDIMQVCWGLNENHYLKPHSKLSIRYNKVHFDGPRQRTGWHDPCTLVTLLIYCLSWTSGSCFEGELPKGSYLTPPKPLLPPSPPRLPPLPLSLSLSLSILGAVAAVLGAGLDSDCGDHLAVAVEEGTVGEAGVNVSHRLLVRTQMRLVLFNPQ